MRKDHDPAVPEAANAYIANGDKLLVIDGKPVASVSGETFEVIDPTTERVLCRVASATAEDVDRAVKKAAEAYYADPAREALKIIEDYNSDYEIRRVDPVDLEVDPQRKE